MSIECKQCGAALTSVPEQDTGDWFIRCFRCGAKNVVQAVLRIVGWRE